MAGHYHHNDASLTQNQGNHVGDRPCVRQSRAYREHNGGNAMKDIMGQGNLAWDTNNMQGAYTGAAHPGHDEQAPAHGQQYQGAPQGQYQQRPPQQQQQQQQGGEAHWSHHQEQQQQAPPPQQQQQQQQQQAHWSHHQEQQPSQARAPQQQQEAHWSHHAEQQPAANQQSGHRGRPGAGAANKTTYNFMTGQ